MSSRRGFLRKVLGAAWVGGCVMDQALFRAVHARAQSAYVLPELFDISRLAEGVYMASAKPQTLINSNAVIFENAEDLLIMDSHSKPSAVASLVRQLRNNVTKKPVRYVVASHFHWDHAQGLPAYKKLAPRADILAAETTRKLIAQETGPRLKLSIEQLEKSIDGLKKKVADATGAERAEHQAMLRETQDYINEMRTFTPELPNVTFASDLVIHDKAHQLHLLFRGRAHTAGDIAVYCPEKKVIATGDMLHGFFPFLADGYPGEWKRTLGKVAELEFDQVAGGHGPAQQGKARLHNMGNLVEEITEVVSRGRRAGKAVAQLEKEITPATLKTLGDNGYGEFVATNILKYRRLAPPLPSPGTVLTDSVRTMVGQVHSRLDA